MWPNAIHKDEKGEKRKMESQHVSEWVLALLFWVETLGKLFHCYLSPADTFLLIFMHCSLCAKSKELSVHNAAPAPLLGRCIQNFEHFKPDYLIVGELSARRNPTNFKWRNNRGESSHPESQWESPRSRLKQGLLCSLKAKQPQILGMELELKIEGPSPCSYMYRKLSTKLQTLVVWSVKSFVPVRLDSNFILNFCSLMVLKQSIHICKI